VPVEIHYITEADVAGELGPFTYNVTMPLVHNEIDEVLAPDPDERAGQLGCFRAAFVPWLATIN